MRELLIATAATILGTVVAMLILRLMGGDRPTAPPDGGRNVEVIGIGNITHTDNSIRNEINHFHHEVNQVIRPTTGLAGDSPDDDIGRMIVLSLAAAGAILGYLLSWPFIVGALAGVALVILGASWTTFARTRHTAGPRRSIVAAATLAVSATEATIWIVLVGAPWQAMSLTGLEAAVAQRFPTFDDGLAERWQVLHTQPADVFKILGRDGATFLLTQLCGIALLGMLLFMALVDIARWWSFRNILAGRRISKRRAARAEAYLSANARVPWTLGAAVISLAFSSGVVALAIDRLQSLGPV